VETTSTSDGVVEGQNEDCTKVPSLDSLPTELVIKILGILPLDVLLKARLVNRMWNLLSNAQLAGWTLSLRHAVTGDIEILYNHELVVVYESPSFSVSKEVKVIQQKTLSLSFEAHKSDTFVQTTSLRLISSVELYLAVDFCGSSEKELLVNYRANPKLWLCFEQPISESHSYQPRNDTQSLKLVSCTWLDGSKNLNLTSLLRAVFRNYTSATFLVASDRGRGVLKASWTRPSSFFKRSGPTKLPNQERSPLRLGQRTVCRRTWRFEEGLDQTKARSVADVRADMVRNSEHWS
jgi:hypothetical protein